MGSRGLSMIAVRQQRRGTSLSKRKSAVDEIIRVYSGNPRRIPTGSGDNARRLSWVEKVRNRSLVVAPKGTIVLETHFPTDLRGIFSLRFAPDGNKFVAAYGAGALQIWYAETDTRCVNVKTAPNHGDPISCIRFLRNSNADKFFAAGTAGIIFLCGMNAGDYRDFSRETPNEINCADVDLDGETLVTAGKDAIVRLYDINTQTIKTKLCRPHDLVTQETMAKFHSMRIFAVRYHPDHREVLMSGGWDDCIKIWDARVPDGCVRQVRGPHICGDALDVRGNTILTGSWVVENSLQLWDFTSGKVIDVINPVNRPRTIDGEFLYCCQFFEGDSSGNTVVCGGSGLSSVDVIDVKEQRITAAFKIRKSIQAIDTTSNFIAFGGMESTFRVAALS